MGRLAGGSAKMAANKQKFGAEQQVPHGKRQEQATGSEGDFLRRQLARPVAGSAVPASPTHHHGLDEQMFGAK